MLGAKLRALREERGLLLKEVAAYMDLDIALLSKIERDGRRAKRDHVVKLAKYYQVDQHTLITLWLSDQINELVLEEQVGIEALRLSLDYITKH